MKLPFGQLVAASVFALSLVVGIGAAHHVSAEESFKDKFKAGCQASGNDYVENASDSSFQCNIKTGGSIKCTDASGNTPCTYQARVVGGGYFLGGGHIAALPVGQAMELIVAPTPPAPHKHHKHHR